MTLILLTRLLRRWSSVIGPASNPARLVGETDGPLFDYLVWMGLGAPLVLAVALVVLALVEGLGGAR